MDLKKAIYELHNKGNLTTFDGEYWVGKFSLDVQLLKISDEKQTKAGNYFIRVRIKDESSEGVLVVWGSHNNKNNINLIKSKPKLIRISRPIRPKQWAIDNWGVDIWAHENKTRVELLEPSKGMEENKYKKKLSK
ncbi:MAG: hypothetical protein ACTSO9_16255 [Candidatus Helarchaeota archaeon]